MGAVEHALSLPRLGRYILAAGGDRHLALRLYVWNTRICQEMYLPAQFAEVCIRNALSRALQTRYGPKWFQAGPLICILPDRLKEELKNVLREEQMRRGACFCPDHVVAGLRFGFWVHLLTKHFDHILWKEGFSVSFAYAPKSISRADLHSRTDQLRNFRNRIAHYNAVFDRKPTLEFQNMMDLVGWISPDTLWLMHQLTNPARVIGQRPKC